eukprot:scaffold7.g3382.t1
MPARLALLAALAVLASTAACSRVAVGRPARRLVQALPPSPPQDAFLPLLLRVSPPPPKQFPVVAVVVPAPAAEAALAAPAAEAALAAPAAEAVLAAPAAEAAIVPGPGVEVALAPAAEAAEELLLFYNTWLGSDCGLPGSTDWPDAVARSWQESTGACRAACSQNSTCVGFTFEPEYTRQGATDANCFLFGGNTERLQLCDSEAGAISGVLLPAAPSPPPPAPRTVPSPRPGRPGAGGGRGQAFTTFPDIWLGTDCSATSPDQWPGSTGRSWEDTRSDCRGACIADSGCVGWTYEPAFTEEDASGANCFLFSNLDPTSLQLCPSSFGSVSGVFGG